MTTKIDNRITVSRNGRFLISRTIITHIYPTDYYRAVLAGAIKSEETEYSDEEVSNIIKEGRLK